MDSLEVHKDLGQLLLDEGKITQAQLDAAQTLQSSNEKSIGRILMDMGLITDEMKIKFLHEKFHFEVVDISGMRVPPHILTRISHSYAEKYRCVPILIEGEQLVVVMEDPANIVVVDEIEHETGMGLLPVLAPLADIDMVLQQYPILTQAQADVIRKRLKAPLWWRIVHPLGFLGFMLLPFFLCWFSITFLVNDFNRWVYNTMRQDSFDVVLYMVLGWSLWAIFVWEMDGIFLKEKEPEK